MKFVDLSIGADDEKELVKIISLASRMGYAALGVRPSLYGEALEEAAKAGVIIYPKVTVEAKERRELIKFLSRLQLDVIASVRPCNLEGYRYAARLKRVDMLRLNPSARLLPDRSTLNLFRSKGGGALEVPLRPLLSGEWDLRDLREILIRGASRGLRIVITSDAMSASELWHPDHIFGLISSLGLPSSVALMGLTSAPGFVISRRGLRPP